MRYVDIDHLHLPDGWQHRATDALNHLRNEVAEAEANAVAAGRDPIAARKTAIAAGLGIQNRVRIWRDLATALGALTQKKCWYSESRNPTADKNVDHFRPKSRVDEDPEHEGYWWLAFDWRNYRYASQWCNQRRVDNPNGTGGGKSDCFPLCPESFRARVETDNWELEQPELLDPIDPEDWKFLTFRQDGRSVPANDPGSLEHRRAQTSIETYHLNCNELVNERRILAATIQRVVQDMERLQPRIADPIARQVYKSQLKVLLRAIQVSADYSAAALAFARAEIYTFVNGYQEKREWLAAVLNLV